ncbi:hypothetical protein Tco_1502978 [Tanacetum coccineum]
MKKVWVRMHPNRGGLMLDEEITLVSVHDMNVSASEEVVEEVVEVINTAKLIVDAAQVSAAGDKVSTASAAITVSAATATTTTITTIDNVMMRYFSFGRHLDGLHVTWAHLEKNRTRLQTNTKTLEYVCSQSLETASQTIHNAATTHPVATSHISRRRQPAPTQTQI